MVPKIGLQWLQGSSLVLIGPASPRDQGRRVQFWDHQTRQYLPFCQRMPRSLLRRYCNKDILARTRLSTPYIQSYCTYLTPPWWARVAFARTNSSIKPLLPMYCKRFGCWTRKCTFTHRLQRYPVPAAAEAYLIVEGDQS
jgi:hypothetical protein